jgi:hypothetical protein
MKPEDIKLEVKGADERELKVYKEIFAALISCGGLTGVRGGKTIIHFDNESKFMGITTDYWVWKPRKLEY